MGQSGQEGYAVAMRTVGQAEPLPCPRQMSHFQSEEWFLLDLKARKRRGGQEDVFLFFLDGLPLWALGLITIGPEL